MIVNSGAKSGQLVGFRAHQQGADEQVVPGKLVDHPDAHAMLGLRPAVEVGDEQLVLVGERQQEIVVEPVERVRVHRLVAVVPPDHVLGQRVLDGELVLRAAAGVLAGADDQRPVLGEQALAAAHGMLDQRRGRQIPEDFGAGRDALRFKSACAEPGRSLSNFPFLKCQKRRRPGWACRRIRMR